MQDSEKVQSSAANGLSKQETEALLGRKMTADETQLYNKTKAVIKLKSKSKKQTASSPLLPAPDNRLPSLKERYTKEQIEDAIVRCNGRWAAIAHMLNCSYNQLRVWMEGHKQHAALAEQLRMSIVDEAEQQIADLLNSSDEQVRKDAAKFILQTIGRCRGWGRDSIVQQISIGDQQTEIKQIFGI